VPSEIFLWLFYINISFLTPVTYASYNFIQSHRTLKHLPEDRQKRAARKISSLFTTLMVLLVLFWLPTAALMWGFAGLLMPNLELSTYLGWAGGTVSHLQGAVSALVSLNSLYQTRFLPERASKRSAMDVAALTSEKGDVLSKLRSSKSKSDPSRKKQKSVSRSNICPPARPAKLAGIGIGADDGLDYLCGKRVSDVLSAGAEAMPVAQTLDLAHLARDFGSNQKFVLMDRFLARAVDPTDQLPPQAVQHASTQLFPPMIQPLNGTRAGEARSLESEVPLVSCLLSLASCHCLCLLPLAFCLLPFASCLLPLAFRLLRVQAPLVSSPLLR
jgi:hypothetical protein